MKVIQLHQEEQEVIRLAIENNRHAQQRIYNSFAPKMLSVCRQYIKDIHQAEDVMIASFMKVFVNLKNYENKGSFEGWIRRIMINESISFLRVNKKVSFISDEVSFDEGSYNELEAKFLLEEIQILIDNLPDGYRMIFNLYVVEGYKHQEIAVMLNINEGTSKSQLSQARKLLQQKINLLNNNNYDTK